MANDGYLVGKMVIKWFMMVNKRLIMVDLWSRMALTTLIFILVNHQQMDVFPQLNLPRWKVLDLEVRSPAPLVAPGYWSGVVMA